MVVGNLCLSTATLKLFNIPVPNENSGTTSMTKIVTLGLPPVDEGCRMERFDFYRPPPKNVFIVENRLFHDVTTDSQPFISTSSDILFASFNIQSSWGYDNISFILHLSALLRHVPKHPPLYLQDAVPWQEWGPNVTRWYEATVLQALCASGQRYLFRPDQSSWELWDFNPLRVRRLGKGFRLESETACLSVETEPSCTKSHGIEKGVYSSLPFIRLVPKQWPIYDCAGLFDDRIIGSKVSPNLVFLCYYE
jgi:hypothetical protein